MTQVKGSDLYEFSYKDKTHAVGFFKMHYEYEDDFRVVSMGSGFGIIIPISKQKPCENSLENDIEEFGPFSMKPLGAMDLYEFTYKNIKHTVNFFM